MASLRLRILANIYGVSVLYLLIASWLGSAGLLYLPFSLPFNTYIGFFTILALCFGPLAGKYLIRAYKLLRERKHA